MRLLTAIDEAQAAGARLSACCELLGISRRTISRWRADDSGEDKRAGPHQMPSNALSVSEQTAVMETINSAPYQGLSPHQIVPKLADEGVYLASEATMYRLLRQHNQLRRRIQTQTVPRKPPHHEVDGPNQLWSWDISYLPGPVRGHFYYLYLIMDVWSRDIVGIAVHETQSAEHAAALIKHSCQTQGITRSTLRLHADNGGPMKGRSMLTMLADLGVIPSFSRSYVKNDNAYSESLFGTAKGRPHYPRQFESLASARSWAIAFTAWYRHDHQHAGIQFVTPAERHVGTHRPLLKKRHVLYLEAKKNHPNRWSGKTRNWSPTERVKFNEIKQPGSKANAA